MNISLEQLKHCKHVKKGTYGSVYTDFDKAYKLYHEVLYNVDLKNPCLSISLKKKALIKLKRNRIEGVCIPLDELYINNVFSGFITRYVDGLELHKLKFDKSLEERKEISLKILKAAKKLTRNNIYNLDYKLNNIILDENNTPFIVDLDDIFTKYTILPNYIYKILSLYSLKEMIYSFMDIKDDKHNYVSYKKLEKTIKRM